MRTEKERKTTCRTRVSEPEEKRDRTRVSQRNTGHENIETEKEHRNIEQE